MYIYLYIDLFNLPARGFSVANMALESTAGLQVPEMNVSLRLSEPLRNGDELRLIAPPGAMREED